MCYQCSNTIIIQVALSLWTEPVLTEPVLANCVIRADHGPRVLAAGGADGRQHAVRIDSLCLNSCKLCLNSCRLCLNSCDRQHAVRIVVFLGICGLSRCMLACRMQAGEAAEPVGARVHRLLKVFLCLSRACLGKMIHFI